MLISDSLPLLWLCYGVLSLIVLAAGYFGVSFLSRLPRWLLVGLVAGMLWTPAYFSVPGPKEQLGYSGWAPGIVVTAIGVMQHNGAQMASAGAFLLVGMGIGAAIGIAIALKWRRNDDNGNDDRDGDDVRARRKRRTTEQSGSRTRREPSM